MRHDAAVVLEFAIVTLAILGCNLGPVDIGELPTDSYSYINVSIGRRFWFPVKDEVVSAESFSFKDYFEVVSVLGQPDKSEAELTNWAKNDVWFLLRSFRSGSPKFFILEVKGADLARNNLAAVAKLTEMFNSRKFTDEAGRPIVRFSGFFLYLSRQEVESMEGAQDYQRYDRLYKDRSRQDLSEPLSNKGFFLRVGEGCFAPINAKIFGGKAEGKLIIVVDDRQPIITGYNTKDTRWNYLGYKVRVVLVPVEDVKCRPELENVLPDPTGFWLNKPLIDWGQFESEKGGQS